jgi:hypothetical protein
MLRQYYNFRHSGRKGRIPSAQDVSACDVSKRFSNAIQTSVFVTKAGNLKGKIGAGDYN